VSDTMQQVHTGPASKMFAPVCDGQGLGCRLPDMQVLMALGCWLLTAHTAVQVVMT
jgi:hypothetical protein